MQKYYYLWLNGYLDKKRVPKRDAICIESLPFAGIAAGIHWCRENNPESGLHACACRVKRLFRGSPQRIPINQS